MACVNREMGLFTSTRHASGMDQGGVAQYTQFLCQSRVNLGYWIAGSEKMNYKAGFRPHQRLGEGSWCRAAGQNS